MLRFSGLALRIGGQERPGELVGHDA